MADEQRYMPPSSGVPMGQGFEDTDILKYATRVDSKGKDGIEESIFKRFGGMLSPHSSMANYGKVEYLSAGFADSITREFFVETYADDSNIIFATPEDPIHDKPLIFNYDSDNEWGIDTHVGGINAWMMGFGKRSLGKDDKNNIFRVIKLNITEHTATSKHDETLQEKRGGILGRARG